MIEGRIIEKPGLHLRTDMGSASLGKIKASISMNIDGKAIFIEFEKGPWVEYLTCDMVRDAFRMVYPKEAAKEKRVMVKKK